MTKPTTKSKGKPVKRAKNGATKTKKTVLPGSADAADLNLPTKRADVDAARLAQMVNLHIAGYSLAQIGEAIGASAAEVDRILTDDVSRYVRNQPALRVFVRNWISEKYGKMLLAVETQATDKDHKDKLEHQDRMLRILKEMARLHGAEAPVQTEITIDTAPETVQRMVDALSRQQGVGYDEDVFDAEVIEEIVHDTEDALLDASEIVGEDQPEDENWDEEAAS